MPLVILRGNCPGSPPEKEPAPETVPTPLPGCWRTVVVGGACVVGGVIIVIDIITIPSGEGACGVLIIRCALKGAAI